MVVVIAQQCEMYLMPLNCRVKMVNFMYLYFTKTSTKTVYSLMSERFKIMWSSSEDWKGKSLFRFHHFINEGGLLLTAFHRFGLKHQAVNLNTKAPFYCVYNNAAAETRNEEEVIFFSPILVACNFQSSYIFSWDLPLNSCICIYTLLACYFKKTKLLLRSLKKKKKRNDRCHQKRFFQGKETGSYWRVNCACNPVHSWKTLGTTNLNH